MVWDNPDEGQHDVSGRSTISKVIFFYDCIHFSPLSAPPQVNQYLCSFAPLTDIFVTHSSQVSDKFPGKVPHHSNVSCSFISFRETNIGVFRMKRERFCIYSSISRRVSLSDAGMKYAVERCWRHTSLWERLIWSQLFGIWHVSDTNEFTDVFQKNCVNVPLR